MLTNFSLYILVQSDNYRSAFFFITPNTEYDTDQNTVNLCILTRHNITVNLSVTMSIFICYSFLYISSICSKIPMERIYIGDYQIFTPIIFPHIFHYNKNARISLVRFFYRLHGMYHLANLNYYLLL